MPGGSARGYSPQEGALLKLSGRRLRRRPPAAVGACHERVPGPVSRGPLTLSGADAAGSYSCRRLRSGLGEKMGSRRRRLDPVGPFGNPDGSRADIEDVISEFVDFGGNPAYGHLATRANDSMVRVIVGKLGAGKTVYLRRLQDFQARQDSVYADVPQQSLPKTEVVVKACQWFSDQRPGREVDADLGARDHAVAGLAPAASSRVASAVARRAGSRRSSSRTRGCSMTSAGPGRSTARYATSSISGRPAISCLRTSTIRSGTTSRICWARLSASASRSISTLTRWTRSSATHRCTG